MRELQITQSEYAPYWQTPCVSILKAARFGATYLNTTIRSTTPANEQERRDNAEWNSFDVLAGQVRNGIYLGCLPHTEMLSSLLGDYFPSLAQGQRGLVVSCNDYFELAGSGALKTIVSPNQWRDNGVEHHHMLMTDFTAGISPPLVVEALAKIKSYRDQGLPVYLHCKAGRARSGMLAVLAIIQENPAQFCCYAADGVFDVNATYDKAYASLVGARKQVTVGQDKADVAKAVLAQYFDPISQQFATPSYDAGDNTNPASHLQSAAFSKYLVQSSSYKSLMTYLSLDASASSKRTACILDFIQRLVHGDTTCLGQLEEIAQSKDGERQDGLFAFSNANPWRESFTRGLGFAPSGKQERHALCCNLRDTVHAWVEAQHPGCWAQSVAHVSRHSVKR